MRSIRGLYIIRSGCSVPALTGGPARADDPAPTNAEPDDGRLGTLLVDFCRFDTWYRIDSWWEGTFMERVARGSFKRTIRNNGDQVKCLFNHGFDFTIGDKILGRQELLEERPESPHMEVPLLDTSYNRDLLPGLRAGGYGSSFMFEVLAEKWVREPEKSEDNPDGLPERTITEVRLFEDGPVTWPANPDATAGMRSVSGTDWLLDQLATHREADRREQLVADLGAFRARYGLRTPSQDGPATPPPAPDLKTPAPEPEPVRHVEGSPAARAARLRALHLESLRRRSDAYSPAGGQATGDRVPA